MLSPQPDPAFENNRPALVVIVGPTAAGKTEVAIQLAERLAGEIVSADSRLFYRGMDIGTAKPTVAERRSVPHHLIDVANPDETWSLAVFQDHARRTMAEIHARGRLPLLVGGTGQYVRAVVQGWQLPVVQPDPRLRQALEAWGEAIGEQALHARLATIDPAAAQSIDARNRRRTVRALEVIFTTGQLFSAQRRTSPSPYRLLTLGINRPRPELYARIDARIQDMLAARWVDEVRGLLAQGYSPDLPALSAIGYREIVTHLQGKLSLEEAVVQIQRNTRIYVRRQANWFKPDDAAIRWFQAGPQTVEAMEAAIRDWLGAPALPV